MSLYNIKNNILICCILSFLFFPIVAFSASETPEDEVGVIERGLKNRKEGYPPEMHADIDWSKCSKTVNVEVGGYYFALPRRSAKNKSTMHLGGRTGLYPCNKIIEIPYFLYRPEMFFGKEGDLLEINISASEGQISDNYTKWKVEEKLKGKGLKLVDLPIESGFYKLEYSGNQFLMISADPNFISHLGNPFTVRCNMVPWSRPNYECGFFQKYKNGLLIGASGLRTNRYPLSEMKEFSKRLIQYVDNELSVKKELVF